MSVGDGGGDTDQVYGEGDGVEVSVVTASSPDGAVADRSSVVTAVE